MYDPKKNLLIGLFILGALGIMTYILMFLHPSMGDEAQKIRVRFDNIDKVNVGTRVLFAGRPIGQVGKITEIEGARSVQMLREGEVYIYELELHIDSDVEVYKSDEVIATTSGLLGEKSVSVIPRPPKPGEPLIQVTDQILYAAAPASLEEAVREFNALSQKAQEFLSKLTEQLTAMDEGFLWENLSTTAENLSDISSAINQPDDLRSIVEKTQDLLEGLSSLEKKVNGSWQQVDDTITNFSKMSGHAKEVAANIYDGKGSIGRLVSTEDFYLQMTSTMSKAETIMDDINHYGLLFHSDSGWQRMRARRANLLRKLSSPQEFQNFFNDEINQISTSLSRVSTVLKEATGPCCTPVVCSREFERVFADLLRRVEGLENDINMYNEQVVEWRHEGYPPPNYSR